MAKSDDLARKLAQLSPSQRMRLENLLRDGGASKTTQSQWSSLVTIQQGTSDTNFFCVHDLSGEVTFYLYLAQAMDKSQSVYSLQAKGIDTDDEPHTRLETMAASYVQAVRKIQPEGPYLLGGFSFGGHVAFEMAQQLHAEGSRVALLALLDTTLLNVNPWGADTINDAYYWFWRFHTDANLELERLRNLAPDQQIEYVLEQLRLSDKPPYFINLPNLDPRRILKVQKANHLALFRYKHKPYPGPITLLRTEEETHPPRPADLGWGTVAAGGLEIHSTPGAHRTMLKSPNIEVVGQVLMKCIAQAT